MIKCKYIITWYNEIENKEINSEGYVFGENYAEAVDQLMRYYGEDETNSFSLEWEDSACSYVCEIKSSE